jgi:hypothetical protein
MEIKLIIENEEFSGRLYDNPTGRKIAEMLPLIIRMSRWGDEYYGSIGAKFPLADEATDEMKVGELAYWPSGSAFCIFFGPTPVSHGNEPRMASEGNPFGMLKGDVSPLKKMGGSISVRVEKI